MVNRCHSAFRNGAGICRQNYLLHLPHATKLEVYTMDAIKVGESAFANGEAMVKVNKAPSTYLYIVTYPDGHRESGKVAVR